MLLIDAGNTYTKVRVLEKGRKKDIKFKTNELKKQIETIPKDKPAVISSVVEEATEIFKSYFKNSLFVTSKIKLPIKIGYETKETLGSDRIAQSCGGVKFYSSFIVASFGTATVIDVVVEKEFVGGWIFPGIALSSICLKQHTSKLPELKEFYSDEIFKPGTSTKECIKKGILLSSVSSLLSIKEKLQLPVLITGGGGKIIASHIKEALYVKDLSLIGLELIGNLHFQFL